MKTIYYDAERERWFHTEQGSIYTFGKNDASLPFSEANASYLSFSVAENKKKLGPLIGILISNSTVKKLLQGYKRSFAYIHRHLKLYGGICIIFTADDMRQNGVTGYVFADKEKKWVRAVAPLPDVVYNRIKNRDDEKTNNVQTLFQSLNAKHIPVFNPSFFSKWELYEILNTNEVLRPHLPETARITSAKDVMSMLKTYSRIYMKPNEGSKGKGIFTLQIDPKQGTIVFQDMKQQKTISHIETLAHLYNFSEYIAQEAVPFDRLNGKRYDLRVLAHYKNGSYEISGIGVRQSSSQQITTHVPNGGRLVPYTLVKERIDELLLHEIIVQCGTTLSAHLGLIGEFSLDIGRTPDGHFYIYELNSKPMVFDEPIIQEQGTKNLIRVFYELSGFPQY